MCKFLINPLGIPSSHSLAGFLPTPCSGIKKALALSFFIYGFPNCIQIAAAAPPTPAVNALPINGQVVAGSAAISQTQTANSATMNVNQSSQRAVINWDSFNVGKNSTVNFNQPNANSVMLNRVTGASQSMIDGAVKANGQVIFVNPNGVTFGRGAEVNAAAVVASTLNIANQEFMNGKATFKDDGSGIGSKAGKIINKGTIQTNQTDPASSEGGFIALLAPEVRNYGYLLAQKGGTVALASGSQITLKIQGQSLIAINVDQGIYDGLISNKRVIEAPNGLVVLAAGAANQLMASVIKNTGVISASSAINNGGVIELVAAQLTQAGTVSSNSQTSQGGQINLVGNDITLAANSATTATGAAGGGQVNIGLANTQVTGGTQVNRQNNQLSTDTNAVIIKELADQAAMSKQLAKTVTIEQNATIDTSATQQGNGGPISIWSELKTTVAGILKSVGGILAGNGGFIETSSSGYVSLAPSASINTSATNGRVGSWLLDPVDLFINAATANIISNALSSGNVTIAVTAYSTSCSLGVCILNGSGAMTIDSGAHILKAGTNYTTLTLSAAGNFLLNGSITGQNLDVVINSSIAYLGVGSSIDASKVTVQAQTIISYGRIQTSNYLFGGGAGTLGNAIELLAQSIFISGALRLNVSSPVVPATIPSPFNLNALPGNLGVNRMFYSTAANDPSMLIVSATSQAASNVINLKGVQADASSYTVVGLEGTAEVLATGSTGGSVYMSANSIYTRSGSFLQANGTVGAGGVIEMNADDITLAGNISAVGLGMGSGGAISLIAHSGTIDLRGGILATNSISGTGGTIYAEVSGISTILADNALSAGLPSSSFDLSKVLFIRERTLSAASGSLSLGYQILNASGNEVTLGTGSYANLSIAGTPTYYSNTGAITNTVGTGTYSNLMVRGLSLSGLDSGQFLLVSIPVQLNVTSAQAATLPRLSGSLAPSPPPPPPPPPAAFTSPLGLPASTKPQTTSLLAPMVAPPPPPASTSAGGSASGGEAGSAPKNVKPQPLVVLSDGSIQLTPPAAPAPPPPGTGATTANAAANKPAPPPDGAKPPPANRPSSGKDGANNNSAEAKRSGPVKDGVDKADSKDKTGKSAVAPAKYVSKYAKGFKDGDKPAPKDASNKPVAGTKANPPREGKYANRINAMNNNPAAFAAMRQNPFAGNISPFPPGAVLQPAPIPVVLRGGDSLVQSYDDVPSIRNSGVVNVARSRNSENYHQSLESVNLMSTLNLFIIR